MRVLIATATAGGGHLQAATALEEAWRRYRPRDAIKRVDTLEFTPRLYRKTYAEGYIKLAEKAPELYAHAFRKTDSLAFVQKISRFRRWSAGLVTRRFLRLVNEFRPDAVLCPHFLPLEAMGYSERKGNKSHPLVACVVTDFEAHALWIEPCADLYFVAAQETKARLVARGISAPNVITTGIPVSLNFSKITDVRRIKRQYCLREDLPILLVLGGGMGMGPLGQTLKELDKMERITQRIVVTGKNEKLRRDLSSQVYQHPTHILGFVTNMHELMAASDLIVTKPGGLTTSESLALGKPMLIVNPLPGQEAANSDFLLEHGAAAKVNRLEDLPSRIDQLLGSLKLKTMSRAAKKLGRPKAATDICKAVVLALKRRDHVTASSVS